MEVKDVAGMKAAAAKLVEMGARAAIVTGGHLEKPVDVLCDSVGIEAFAGDHVKSENTHGSGCTFSSAVAAQLAAGQHLRDAVILAKALRHEGDRKIVSDRQGRRTDEITYSDFIKNRHREVSTKFPSTECIQQQNPPHTDFSTASSRRAVVPLLSVQDQVEFFDPRAGHSSPNRMNGKTNRRADVKKDESGEGACLGGAGLLQRVTVKESPAGSISALSIEPRSAHSRGQQDVTCFPTEPSPTRMSLRPQVPHNPGQRQVRLDDRA